MFSWAFVLWSLGLGLVGILGLILWQAVYWRLKGMPCVDTVPLIGVFGPLFLRQKSFVELSDWLYNSCPGARYFGCMDFGTPTLIIKDPELVKEIGVKNFDYFPNHRGFVEPDFDPLLAKNVFSLKDDRWREMRATLSPTFTASKMKYMFQLVCQCSTDFVDYLKEHREITMEMDIKDVYTRYTTDVIASAAFGISVNSMKDRENDFYVYGKDASSFDGLAKNAKFIGARVFPKLMRFLGFRFLTPDTDRFFKKLINDTVQAREERGIVRPDMIHLLMQARDNKNGIEMTTDDIIAQAFIFFLAGFETSSRLMSFVSHILSYYPDVQERLRHEIDDILHVDDDNVTYEALARMKYLDMIIAETLRLYPPSPVTDRVCVKSFELPPPSPQHKPFVVQPNTILWIPIYSIQRDPRYFPDPDKFDPERFSDETKTDNRAYTYIPFGFGPRKCIGERFALMETKILIAHLVRNFYFKPSNKTTKDIIFTRSSFVMGPDCGFWTRLEPRK